MRAATFERYGDADVVHVTDRPAPRPAGNELLIRVVTTTVNSADWRLRSLSVPPGFGLLVRLYMGFSQPKRQVLGVELAGCVEAVGDQVTRFATGDEVIAFTGTRLGAHAEFVCIPESAPVVPKPAGLGWDEAAALCFGGTAALDFLVNKARLQAGESLLINGASGSVGLAAVQIASHLGARVTAVCAGASADLVRGLGAHEVIDYHERDFARTGASWDVILDAVGNAPYSRVAACLKPNGRLLMVVATMGETLKAMLPWRPGGRRCVAGTAREHPDDVRRLVELAGAGAYRPVIDSVYPFENIAAAHRRFDEGSKHGSLVIRVSAPGPAP